MDRCTDERCADIVDVYKVASDVIIDEWGKPARQSFVDERGDESRGVLQWSVDGVEAQIRAREALLFSNQPEVLRRSDLRCRVSAVRSTVSVLGWT